MLIALIHNWPGNKDSEYDLMERIRNILISNGHQCLFIDSFGRIIEQDSGELKRPLEFVDEDKVDFGLSFHFLTPQLLDFFTYTVNWNPLNYILYDPCTGDAVKDRHYDFIVRCFQSHDYLLSGGSQLVDDFVRAIAGFKTGVYPNSLELYTSAPIIPNLPDIKLDKIDVFYIGRNWEKIAEVYGRPINKRHEELLHRLDQSGHFSFYGPRTVYNVPVWEGIKNYRGPLPFDGGRAVIETANAHGIALVLSSDAHRHSGVVSTRLFQACAAGCVIISDDNPFIEKHFGDSVLMFKYEQDAEGTYRNIANILGWIQSNPEEAYIKAKRSHTIFRERYSLDEQIIKIVASHPHNLLSRNEEELLPKDTKEIVDVICFGHRGPVEINSVISQLNSQINININFLLLSDPENRQAFERKLSTNLDSSISCAVIDAPKESARGKLLRDSISRFGKGNTFFELTDDVHLKKDTLSMLCKRVISTRSSIIQTAAYIKNRDFFISLAHKDAVEEMKMATLVLRPVEVSDIVNYESYRFHPSVFMFERSLLESSASTNSLLDCTDAGYFFVLISVGWLDGQALPRYLEKLCVAVLRDDEEFLLDNRYETSVITYEMEKRIVHQALKRHPNYRQLMFGPRQENETGGPSIPFYAPFRVGCAPDPPFSVDAYFRGILKNRPSLMRVYSLLYRRLCKLLKLEAVSCS